jgi:hypothetical protein
MDIGGWYTGKRAAQQQASVALPFSLPRLLSACQCPAHYLFREGGQPLFRGLDNFAASHKSDRWRTTPSEAGPCPHRHNHPPSTVSAQPDGSGTRALSWTFMHLLRFRTSTSSRLQTGYPFVRRSSQPQPEDVGMLFDQSQLAHLSPVQPIELNRSNTRRARTDKIS